MQGYLSKIKLDNPLFCIKFKKCQYRLTSTFKQAKIDLDSSVFELGPHLTNP